MTKEDQDRGRRLGIEADKNEMLGLPWPEAYSDILPLVRDKWGIEGGFYLNRKLGGGKSGALVYAADIESREFTGQAILKLDEVPDPSGQEQHEADLHNRAISDAPDFAAGHLPKLLHTLHHDKQIAVLSTIAGRGLQYAAPWTECTFEKQLQITRDLSRGLLEDWNRDYRRQQGMRHPKDLLQSWLGYRLEPERGGRIHDFLAARCGLTPDVPSITFEGHWYPNPLAFALEIKEIPHHLRLRSLSGRVHGDLHGQNVLVGRPESAESDYYLIDLAFYQSEQYLFYDHAYFEFVFLLNSRANVSALDWNSLLEQLSHSRNSEVKNGSRAEDIGLIELVMALRQEVSSWVDRHEGDRLSYMESQYLLARVAVGLSFTHKNISDAKRRKALIYAAANLKDYIKLNGLDWPKHGPPLLFDDDAQPAEQSAVSDMVTDRLVIDQLAPLVSTTPDPAPQAEHHSDLQAKRPMSFFSELQRRHVVKVAGLYLLAAWVCVQVTAMMKVSLLLPPWTDTFVTVLLALGFPFACIFAWAFEMSPTGLQRTTALPPGKAASPPARGLLDYVIAAGIVGLLVFTVWRYAFDPIHNQQSASVGGNQLPTIAVLPFRNLSDNGTGSNFSDGLTIEIMATLARTGQLRISGQSSTFRYKDQGEDLRKIGQELGVQYLLEGSVRRVGNDVRVESQLIEANDGFLIWSDVFADKISDIFVIQEKIANAIGAALKTPLGITASGLQTGRTANPEAYDLFLNALALSGQQGEGVNAQIAAGIDLLKKSVEIDPEFAAGWAALSLAYDFGVVFPEVTKGRHLSQAGYVRRAAETALKARELNPDLAIVEHAMGNVHRRARQWTSAEAFYKQALEKEPNNVLVLMDYARLLAIVGYDAEAIAMTERVGQIDPHNPLFSFTKTLYALQAEPNAENFEKHLDGFGKERSFAPFVLRSTMGYLFESGQVDRLRKLISDCRTCDGSWRDRALSLVDAVGSVSPDTIYNEYKDSRSLGYPLLQFIGGNDLVLRSFTDNSDNRSFNFQAYLVPWTQIEHVGRTEKFRELIDDIGFDDYWRERGWPDHCKPSTSDEFEFGCAE